MSSESVCQVACSWMDMDSFIRVYLESCMWPVVIFTMDHRKEQRVCIKFCANLGKSATETLTMIKQAFRDQSSSHVQVFQWHSHFKTGCTSVDDDEQTGRPTSCTTPETVAWIQELVCQDWRRTIHDIGEEVGIGYGTCQQFWRKNWACTTSQPNLCLGSRQMTRSSSVSSALNWKTKWLSSPTHHTPLLWHPVTSSYFKKWNWSWKNTGLIPMRYRPNRRECLTLW